MKSTSELSLKDRIKLYELIIEKSPIGIYFYDSKGKIMYGNPEAEKITGYKSKEIEGNTLIDMGIIPESEIENVKKLLELNLAGKGSPLVEINVVRKNGDEIVVQDQAIPTTMGKKIVFLGIFSDITKRKNVTEELHNRIDELEKLLDLTKGREKAYEDLSKELIKLRSKK